MSKDMYKLNNDPSDFKVNKWMRKMGWVWLVTPGTPEKPNPFDGAWHPNIKNVAINKGYLQSEAVLWYRAAHAKTELAQRLMRALRHIGRSQNATGDPKRKANT